jgi:hypothetical protein
VVATGNHYLFDIAAGLAVTGIGFAAGLLVSRVPRPIAWGRAQPAYSA